ncbi:phosphatidylinositol 3-kinase C2 domain-containing subunit gamma isoform X1 [Labeo rohita]|uniref:phosphatidylinositol 3-kinase C2 domain-containing subunit gamma isoform X1 n=2 Tax=Labeo rohita TaxID=84645 RepID=UPI0021E2F380|nr:phosphatidylinositol 3-kinase C2 domain-containing subunit gamma isoform X1 [Labeo rohita]XP_050991770.1 phosphatidylinositol 3-kinase C2 domain-containing subunit gamma isoform X1 [Labeo rohita]XP_050991772.1 phosphatidylinositol 3-kinase C2 domain-containing subunit gamma isoform X1 [Labeo rohita]
MDPCQNTAGRPEDHVFQGWDVPFFSEQDYLGLYTALSDSDADQRNQEQMNRDMKNEETAGAPAGSAPLRSPEPIQPIAKKSCDGVTMDFWNINLIDSPQGSNSRTASLCMSTLQLLSEYGLSHDEFNLGVLWARVAPQHGSLLESAELLLNVFVPWLPVELPYRSRLNSTAQEVIEAVLVTLDRSATLSGQFLIKLCDSEEYLKSDSILGLYERIQVYQKFASDVPVRMVLKDTVDKTLTRDEEDNRQIFHFNQVLASACAFNTIRSCLEEKLNSYSQEVNKFLRSQCGVSVSEVVESVHAVCEQLCGVTTVELEEAIGRLQRFATVTLTPAEMCDCETAVLMLHHALLKLLCIFFTNFDLDFRGQEDHPNPPAADIMDSSCMLQVNLTCLYRLLPGWINSYDHFSVSCSLTYCGRNLTEPVLSENISTSLQLHYKIQCNRLLVFPVLIKELPYESMLCFHLLGSKQAKNPELLCWAVLPLFNNRTLVHGTVLLSMSTQVPPICPPSPALTDGHRQPTGVILQIDFPESEQWQYERVLAQHESVLELALCEELQKRITEVCQKHCLSLMTDNEKAFLWSKRHTCSQRNSYLHLVLGSAPQWRPQNLPEIYFILERWSPVSTEEALFLLSDEFHDQYVRSVAVQRFQQMCDSELEDFLPQLVQALKMEWDIDGPLMKLLLSRSLHCIRIAQQLYWLLMDALDDWLYNSWMNKILSALKHCCGRALRSELQRESRLVDLLTQVAEKIRTADKTKRKDVFNKEKCKIASFFADGLSCRLPLDPAVVVKDVNIEAFKVFNSNAVPMEVSFITTDPLGQNYSVICKTGDNLRQDMLVLQIVRVLDRIWRQEGLDMRMVMYRCMSTGRDQGLVEVVRDAVTLAKIHQEWGLSGALREDTLEKWFHMRNKTKDDYEKAVMNFLYSCAGWCVATFVLGIRDRHNDNIMIKHSGHMFHIDFGKIMGNAQKFGSIKRDRTPFIFTPEMQRFITGGGENPQRFHRFVELCCEAYNSLRRRSALVLSLLQLMLAAGMPELKDVQDLQYVHNKLRPHDSELEATSYFTRKIKESMESLPVKLNFLIHTMAQISSIKRSEVHAKSQISSNNNIQEAVIQKYTVNGKNVTYELKVTIEDGYLIVQKSFAQFEIVHKQLQKHFIESTLPKFPSWFNMSFTPSRKMSLLNKYLKELFEGPCKGNEYVCSLFLDGPNANVKSETDTHLRPQIQLYLSYKDYKLSVMIKHLKNIRLSNGSCPDAYVVTRLRPDPQEKTKRKTKVVRSNDNPTFNELIEYRNVPNLHGHVLEVTVKSRKTFVAATNVVLGERVLDQEKWFPLGFSAV